MSRIASRSPKLGRLLPSLGLALCLLAAAGCAVGPDYKRPETKVPDNWNGQEVVTKDTPSKTTTDPAELVAWWSNFKDPTLSSLVEMAIRANLDLRLAEARIRQARASLGVAVGGIFPEVDATALYERSHSPIVAVGPSGGGSSGGGGRAALREADPPRALQLRRFGNYFRWVWMPPGK